jgi:hypothetical protein
MEACDETEYRHSCSDECLLKEVERFFRIKENDSTYMEIETENGHLR